MRKRQPRFLPTSMEDAKRLGIDQFDVIVVSGDAYVDHPAFSTAIVGRVLWEEGFSVGVIAQPDWKGTGDFLSLGAPPPLLCGCTRQLRLHGEQLHPGAEEAVR